MNLLTLAVAAIVTLKPESRASYTRAWKRFIDEADLCTLEGLKNLTSKNVQATLEQMRKTFSPATVAVSLAAVRHVVRYGISKDVLTTDPTIGVKAPIGDNVPRNNVLRPGELETFVKKLDPFERAVVLALGLQGLRISELCNAKWADVGTDRDGPTLRLVGKGDKFATMGLQKLVLEAAEAWRKKLGGSPLYLVASRQGKRLNRSAASEAIALLTIKHLGHRVSAHGLRATFVSDVISRKGIEVARQLARHSSIVTTQRYSRWVSIRDDERTLT